MSYPKRPYVRYFYIYKRIITQWTGYFREKVKPSYIRVIPKGEGLQGKGEALGAVVETSDRGEAVEGHVIIDFGSDKGPAAMVI